MADIDELLRQQADAVRLAEKLQGEKDPARIQEIADQVLARARELEKAALHLAAAAAPRDRSGGEVRVLLTKGQRERIAEQTGVGVEAVTLRDTRGRRWASELPKTEPRVVEKLAAQEAAASRLAAETRDRMEKIVRQLRALNEPALEETIRELERGPARGAGKQG